MKEDIIEQLKKEYKESNKRGTSYCGYQVRERINEQKSYLDYCRETDSQIDWEYYDELEEDKEIPNRITESIFLTEASAQRFIDRKRHDLSKPFIYGVSHCWNTDLIELMQSLGIEIHG